MGDSSGRASVFSGESDGNTNLRLCSVLLNGFNYIPWSRAVSLALGGRSKLGFINGNIPAPAVDDPKYEDWFCKDQLVMSWLLNSMEPQVAEIFSFFDSAQHLWTAVKEMYGNENNAARIFQLKKDIVGFANFLQQYGKSSTSDVSGIVKAFVTALISSTMSNVWVIDSGATDHMTNKKQYLCDFENFTKAHSVSVANGTDVTVLGQGKVKFLGTDVESTALYVP
ncbi:unnamed protein product, partial [Prunus brigantina]